MTLNCPFFVPSSLCISMQHKPRTIRKPLKDLLGEVVNVEGLVKEIKNDGSNGCLDVLLINTKITHLVSDKTIPQCNKWSIDHLWIKDKIDDAESDFPSVFFSDLVKLNKKIFAQGTPYRYMRADGSVDYGVRTWSALAPHNYMHIESLPTNSNEWEQRAKYLENIVTRASNNQLRLNTRMRTHNEMLVLLKRFLKQARINNKAVNKAPRGKKPKVPTFAQLFKTKT